MLMHNFQVFMYSLTPEIDLTEMFHLNSFDDNIQNVFHNFLFHSYHQIPPILSFFLRLLTNNSRVSRLRSRTLSFCKILIKVLEFVLIPGETQEIEKGREGFRGRGTLSWGGGLFYPTALF